MLLTDAVRALATRTGHSLRSLSVAFGRSPNFIANTLNRGSDMTCNTLACIAKACGYALVLVPTRDVPPTALVVDAEGE